MATREDLKRVITEGAQRGGYRLPTEAVDAIAEQLDLERPIKGTRRASLQKIAKDVVGDPRIVEAVDFSDLDSVLDELRPSK
jgi:hypothetical protein